MVLLAFDAVLHSSCMVFVVSFVFTQFSILLVASAYFCTFGRFAPRAQGGLPQGPKWPKGAVLLRPEVWPKLASAKGFKLNCVWFLDGGGLLERPLYLCDRKFAPLFEKFAF